jgi:hypothetical protein
MPQWLIMVSRTIFVRLKYGVYDSVCPWVFHQVYPLPPSGCPESRHAKKYFLVILTNEISSNKGTIVHGGAIAVSAENGTVSRSIIMKVGFNEDKPLIEGEYNTSNRTVCQHPGSTVSSMIVILTAPPPS